MNVPARCLVDTNVPVLANGTNDAELTRVADACIDVVMELTSRGGLFGEWCYAKHSISYDHLPDWFLAFDVYECNNQRFWSVTRRNRLAKEAQIATVPEIARGVFRMPSLNTMLEEHSALGDVPREGLYLRREDNDWLLDRAKLVRSDFTQAITEHWSKRGSVRNHVQPTVHAL